jgi:hypothetical protein
MDRAVQIAERAVSESEFPVIASYKGVKGQKG